MQINDVELQALRTRWCEGKYRVVREALEHILPQAEWMDMCDVIDHPEAKRLANDLRGVQLCGKDLKNLDLGDSFLEFAVFDRSRFDGAQFQWSIMNGASFRECTFRLTQMIIVFGEGMDFHGAAFERAYIEHAKIEKSKFSTVTMHGGTLSNSGLKDSDFSGIRFTHGKFESNDARRCDFSGGRFVECNFSASRLQNGRLVGASFESCDLTGVDFRGVNLEGVAFRGGTFSSAPEGSVMDPTRFDDTPEARRAVAAGSTENRDTIEWCPVIPDSSEPVPQVARPKLRGMPGELVPQSGWWVSPALGSEHGRRYFKVGEKFPDIKFTDWGLVIWTYNSAG